MSPPSLSGGGATPSRETLQVSRNLHLQRQLAPSSWQPWTCSTPCPPRACRSSARDGLNLQSARPPIVWRRAPTCEHKTPDFFTDELTSGLEAGPFGPTPFESRCTCAATAPCGRILLQRNCCGFRLLRIRQLNSQQKTSRQLSPKLSASRTQNF